MDARYELQEVIAAGPRSTVQAALDRATGRRVVVKRFADPAEAERERAALSACPGPHVVRLLASGESGLVLEWVPGQTLEHRLQQGPLTAEAFMALARQSLHALTAVHAAGYLHRDVTPANLLVCPPDGAGDWRITLIDFGQARPAARAAEDPLTGSVHTMAPEQFRGGPLDVRTDLYALGCTLQAALTGRLPHEGGTAAQVIAGHLHGDAEFGAGPHADLPPAVLGWVRRLRARQPEDRPEDARAAGAELERAFSAAG